MSHSHTLEAIILKTYDVGDADRFCILLTRERGRLAARARGVRKLTSRMGGSLLPLQRVTVELREGSAGFLITSVQHRDGEKMHGQLQQFLVAQEAVESLLHLLHDEEPVEDVFELTAALLDSSSQKPVSILPFKLRLLECLGILPPINEGKTSDAMTEEERTYVSASLSNAWQSLENPSSAALQRLTRLCQRITEEHTSQTAKVQEVVAEMQV